MYCGLDVTTRIHDGLGEPDAAVEGDAGASFARYWVVEERIVVAQVKGMVTVEFSECSNSLCDRLLSAGKRIYLVSDWGGIENYAPGCRTTLVKWSVKNLKHIVAGYYFARTPVLHMSLQVASLAFGGSLNTFNDEAAFLAAFAGLRRYVRAKTLGAKTGG